MLPSRNRCPDADFDAHVIAELSCNTRSYENIVCRLKSRVTRDYVTKMQTKERRWGAGVSWKGFWKVGECSVRERNYERLAGCEGRNFAPLISLLPTWYRTSAFKPYRTRLFAEERSSFIFIYRVQSRFASILENHCIACQKMKTQLFLLEEDER